MTSISGKGSLLFQLIPENDFKALCDKWEVDKGVREFCAAQHIRTFIMIYLLRLESLREVEFTLGVSRSTFSDANASRSSGFFQEVCELVLNKIAELSHRKIRKAIRTILAVDSTECQIHGSASKLRKWAQKSTGKVKGKAAAKLHIVWNVDGEWIEDFRITAVRIHDLSAAREFKISRGCHYVFDRIYNDLSLWWKIAANGSHFVTRLKQMPVYRMRTFSVVREKKDAVGVLWEGSWKPSKPCLRLHPEVPKDVNFRLIIYKDPDSKKVFNFITSDLESNAQEIADCYKRRWAVELLFRWMKGHFNIRYLPLKNTNAVKVQLAAAVLTQLLVQLDRMISDFKGTLWEYLRALRVDLARNGIQGSNVDYSGRHHPEPASVVDLALRV